MENADNQHHSQRDPGNQIILKGDTQCQQCSVSDTALAEPGEDRTEHLPACRHRSRPEKEFSGEDNRQHFDRLQYAPRPAAAVNAQLFGSGGHQRLDQLARYDQHKIVHTIEQVRPTGAMPHAIAQPDRKERDQRLRDLAIVLAQLLARRFAQLFDTASQRQRIENIVFEPRAQRNMPPAPELRRILCKKGLAEVFRQRQAEHLSCADGHIDAA